MKTPILALLLAAPACLHALDVQVGALDRSAGFLRCYEDPEPKVGADGPEVLSRSWEDFRTASSQDEFIGWLTPGPARIDPPTGSELFFFEREEQILADQKVTTALEDPSSGRLFTFWHDQGFEASKHAIVVWKKSGETLTFEATLDHALTVTAGKSYFSEIRQIAPDQYVLIGRTAGDDGGTTSNSLWVALWTEPRSLRTLFATQQQRGDYTSESTVLYEFDPKTMRIDIIQVTRSFGTDRESEPDQDGMTAWKHSQSYAVIMSTRPVGAPADEPRPNPRRGR